MSTENITLTGECISDAKLSGRLINNFDEEIDKIVCNYISYYFKVSLCIYHGVGDLTDLKETQLEISNEFKRFCEVFSKYKRLTRIIFIPCQNKDESSTIDEKFEFLLNYDENNDFINKEGIEKYLKFYTTFKTAEKLADLKTKYEYNNEFELLIIKVREIIENMENSRINVVSLISKLMDSQIIVDKLQIGRSRDNLRMINNRLVKKYRKFKNDYYHKCILELQKTFEYENSSNITENCIICLEEFDNGKSVTKLKCGHVFCTKCIEEWFSQSTTCPHCRKNFD